LAAFWRDRVTAAILGALAYLIPVGVLRIGRAPMIRILTRAEHVSSAGANDVELLVLQRFDSSAISIACDGHEC